MKRFLAIIQSNSTLTVEQFTAYLAQDLRQDLALITTLDELLKFKDILFEFSHFTGHNDKSTIEKIYIKRKQELTDSSQTGNSIFVQELASLKTIATQMQQRKQKTSLLEIVRNKNLTALEKALAEKNIDLDEEDASGNALLIIALQNEFNQGFKLLLQKGANINCRDKSTYEGLLEMALAKNNTEALASLCSTKYGKELIATYLHMIALKDGSLFVNIKTKNDIVKQRLHGLSLFDKGLENAGVAQGISVPAYFNESYSLLVLFTYFNVSRAQPEFESLPDQDKDKIINRHTPLLSVLNELPKKMPKRDKQRVYLELYRMVKVLVSDEKRDVKLQAIHAFEIAIKAKPNLWEKCRPTLMVLICAAVGLVLGITLVGALGIFFGVWANPAAVAAALYGLTTANSITAWSIALVGVPVISSLAAGFMAKCCFFKASPLDKIAANAYCLVANEQVPKL